MTRRLRVCATVAAATLALGLGVGVGASPAQASTTGWHKVWRSWSWTNNQLFSVAAISAGNAWAAGYKGTAGLVMHWNGSDWSRRTVPGLDGYTVFDVGASAWNNVWLFAGPDNGGSGKVLRWNGSSWLDVPLPSGVVLENGTVLSASDVWAVGPQSCSGTGTLQCQTLMYHWNGSAWSTYAIPALVDEVSGSSADNVWVSAEGGASFASHTYYLNAYKWNGSAWHFVSSMPTPHSNGTAQITVASRGNVWLGAWRASDNDGYLLHWNGSYWARHNAPNSSWPTQAPLVTDGHSGVWFGPFVHWTGTKWINAVPGNTFVGDYAFALRGLARIPGRTTLWGVGEVSRNSAATVWDSLIAVHGTLP